MFDKAYGFYGPIDITTIEHLLRRTLVRSDRLSSKAQVFLPDLDSFTALSKPTPGRFSLKSLQLHPSEEGMVYNSTGFPLRRCAVASNFSSSKGFLLFYGDTCNLLNRIIER